MRWHHAMVSTSRSASGTTALTRPMRSASAASYCSQRNQISRAFFWPTLRASSPDPEVAHDVQHVAAADRVARDHGHHRLGEAPDLNLEVEDVQAADAVVPD